MSKASPDKQKTRPDLSDELWLAWVAALPENRGLMVRELYRKMLEWCHTKGVTPTRRRLLKWLDNTREEIPLTYEPAYFEKPGDECGTCSGSARIQVNDLSSPCPKCRPTEEKAFWKSRGR